MGLAGGRAQGVGGQSGSRAAALQRASWRVACSRGGHFFRRKLMAGCRAWSGLFHRIGRFPLPGGPRPELRTPLPACLPRRRRGADDGVAGMGANAKLPGGRLVVRVAEAMPDAGAVDDVTDKGTRESGGAQTVAMTRVPKGSGYNLLGAGSHAAQVECVRVQESEEENRACAETCEMLLPRFQTAHQAESNMAVIAVSREASNPIQPPEIEGRNFQAAEPWQRWQ